MRKNHSELNIHKNKTKVVGMEKKLNSTNNSPAKGINKILPAGAPTYSKTPTDIKIRGVIVNPKELSPVTR